MPSQYRARVATVATALAVVALILAVPPPVKGIPSARFSPLVHPPNPAVAGSQWFNVTAGQRVSPPALAGASLVYDPADSELVLFGGCSPSACPAPAQTWVYFSGAWTNITASGPQPPARAYAGFAFDSRDGYAVLFGGKGASGPLNDTWSFVGGVWTNLTNPTQVQPSPRWASQLGFDRVDNYVVLFGGCAAACPLNDTWHFAGGAWRNVTATLTTAPAPRFGAGFAFDMGDNYLLLEGGCGAVCPLNDTWQFSRGHWTPVPVTPGTAPPARSFGTLTFDVVQNATFLFGGNGSTGPLGDTWRWAGGKWVNMTSQVGISPSPRMGAAALPTTVSNVGATVHKWTFDLLFGGTAGPTPTSAGAADSQTWVAEPPPSVSASVDPSVVEVGQTASFTSVGAGGSAPYVFLWQFGDGTSSLSQNPIHIFLAAGMLSPNVTMTDSAGVSLRSTTTLTVVLGPTVSLSIQPAVTDVDRTVTFSAQATGGTAPYLFHWSFGDGSTATTASAAHTYDAADTYQVNLTVTDTVLGFGVQFANVTVHPDPMVTTTVSVGAPTIGETVDFSAVASLGTGPYTYRWSFGDGNTSTNASPSHSYGAAGVYLASITVTDSVGGTVTQNFSLRVTAAPPSGGGPARWFGLTSVQWGYVVLALGGILAAVAAAILLFRHHRRPAGTPIAAAAVGQPGWGDDEAPGPQSTSRSFRRNYRR